jgi:thioredoxin-like negative regulator of GroEL
LELASQAYQAVLERQPDNTGAILALAGVRFTQKRFADASALYKRALALNPKDMDARRALAELNVAQDQPFAALEQFNTLTSEQTTTNPELNNRIQRLEVDILKRRGFQPYWERY